MEPGLEALLTLIPRADLRHGGLVHDGLADSPTALGLVLLG